MTRQELIMNLLSQLQEMNITAEELKLYNIVDIADDEVQHDENIIYDF